MRGHETCTKPSRTAVEWCASVSPRHCGGGGPARQSARPHRAMLDRVASTGHGERRLPLPRLVLSRGRHQHPRGTHNKGKGSKTRLKLLEFPHCACAPTAFKMQGIITEPGTLRQSGTHGQARGNSATHRARSLERLGNHVILFAFFAGSVEITST
jgi:hypothetical protein